jgi:hypothetical protein
MLAEFTLSTSSRMFQLKYTNFISTFERLEVTMPSVESKCRRHIAFFENHSLHLWRLFSQGPKRDTV